ncbi:hypothetical protein ACVLD2_004540 [Paenibacillus sp. PvR052]|nr:hypothetical protein [Paenibacillus sp. PvP091]MBP1172225.1 hypothetical protein [Paenibacillus sp. PvR098]MBP2438606.1 hypothetical protein [Paenibacillus sp. PvP052]
MKAFFKKIFANTCPQCNETLSSKSDPIGYVKVCPQGHYKEETYSVLEVKIMNIDLK